MAKATTRLGRGLSTLISPRATRLEIPPAQPDAPHAPADTIRSIPIDRITPNPRQPRLALDDAGVAELADSIRTVGVLQPVVVRPLPEGGYELVAGERRWRAARLAGNTAIPAVVRHVTDAESLEIALIENLQRADLNAIEEAGGYRTLAEKFSMTQEQIAQRVGKARASVANAMRLLDLPAEVGQLVVEGKLSPGHAKVLLGLEIAEEQILIAKRIVAEGMSVRDAEKLVEGRKRTPRKPRAKRDDIPRSHLLHLCEVLQRHLGTPVRIAPCKTLANGKKVKGRIEVDYFSPDDLDRVLELLGISLD